MENCLASVLMRMSIMSLLQVKMQIDGGTFYTVSYTHLDVYKRQVQRVLTDKRGQMLFKLRKQNGSLHVLRSCGAEIIYCTIDVYKRQESTFRCCTGR